MKTGLELIAEIGQYPTLNTILDRNPVGNSPTFEEYVQQIKRERAERVLFVIKEQAKKAKKSGQEEGIENVTSDKVTNDWN